MDEKKYEIVEIQVDADVLEELKKVIAPHGTDAGNVGGAVF